MTFMARRESQTFYTRFQEWLSKAMDRRGVNLKWVSTETGLNYENLWKVARGNPERYPSRTRLDYHNTKLVGSVLDDEAGALKAAGYESSGELPEIEREPDPEHVGQFLSHYEGNDPAFLAAAGAYKALRNSEKEAVLMPPSPGFEDEELEGD